jgi:hypothetical protein
MFGLEKKPGELFEFDLEKELKADHTKAKKTLKTVEERIHEIKQILRQGAGSEDFDNYGTLLHAYVALQKVLTKTLNKK